MNHETFVPVARQSTPNCALLVVALHDVANARRQRAFFSRLYREARAIGLVMSHKTGLCIFFGAERVCTSWHRHRVLNWLVDQPEVASVQLADLLNLKSLACGHGAFPGLITNPADRLDFARLVRRVALGAARQWLSFVEGRLA